MGLAAPLALLGVLGIGLPIMAHLWRRRELPEQRLATLALLRRAESRSRAKMLVADPWLLALRAALVTIAAVSAAAPFVTTSPAWGDGRARSLVLVVDDSMSMGRLDGTTTLLAQASSRARAILDALPEGSEASVVLAGAPARVAVPRTTEFGAAHAVLATLDDQAARGTELERALGLAGRQLSGARHAVRQVVMLSDLAGLEGAPGPSWPSGIALEIERMGPSTPGANLAITDALVGPVADRPDALAVDIEVRAFEDTRPEAVVSIVRRGVELARGTVRLIDGVGRLVLEVPHTTGEGVAAEARLLLAPPDALPRDDVRGVLLRPPSSPHVVLVDGAPRALGRHALRGGGSAVRFLAQALGLAPPEVGRLRQETMDPEAFVGWTGTADVVVLADVAPDTAGLPARLDRHLEDGGGLLVAAGPHTRAEALLRFGRRLPARVVSVVDGDLSGLSRRQSAGVLSGPAGLDTTRAQRRLALDPEAGAQVLLSWSDGTAALVLDPNARTAVLGTTLDDTWSDLPFQPGFLPLVVGLMHVLAPPGTMPDAPLTPGHAFVWTPPAGALSTTFVDPAGGLHAGSAEGLREAVLPGAWTVMSTSSQHGPREEERAAFVVAAPPSESALRPGTVPEPPAAAPASTAIPSTAQRSLAPWAFALVGVAALVEGAARRRRASATAR